MFQILSYSGISTKARAMGGKLLKKEQYEQLLNCSSVSDALSVLKQFPAYQDILKDFDEASSHRGTIEAALRVSLYRDFNRLYRFAGRSQRRFLDFYFIHFENAFLKVCLRSAFSGSDSSFAEKQFQDNFRRHSGLAFSSLMESHDIESFLQALEGSPYYGPLQRITASEYHSLFDYESGLDQFMFSLLWEKKDRLLSGKERELITQAHGQRMDLLNIQWILRAKQYYNMSPVEIYAMIIPCRYKLKKKDIIALAEAPSYEETLRALDQTWYGHRYHSQMEEIGSIEQMYTAFLEEIFTLSARRNPYTIAPLNAYLYNKEHEITTITNILEGIRYGLSRQAIASHITKLQ